MLENTLASLRNTHHQPISEERAAPPSKVMITTITPASTDGSNNKVEVHIQPNGQLSVMDFDGLKPDGGVNDSLDTEVGGGNLVMDETRGNGREQFSDSETGSCSDDPIEDHGVASAISPQKNAQKMARKGKVVRNSRGDNNVMGKDNKNQNNTDDTSQHDTSRSTRQRKETCIYCDLAFRTISGLYMHIQNKHFDVEGVEEYLEEVNSMRKCVCTVCNKRYSSRTQLEIHKRTMHVPQEKAKCSECGIVVKSKAHLKIHMWRSHTARKQNFLCHLCPASFKVQSYLADHLKNVHSNNALDTFSCSDCDFTCSSLKYLRSHMCRVHRGRRYPCPHCQKAFTLAPNMKRHIELVHNTHKTSYTCPECLKHFSLKSNLKEHINSMHLKRFSFKCSLCEAGFRRRRELDAHQTLHNAALWSGQPAIFVAPIQMQNTNTTAGHRNKNSQATIQLAPIIMQSSEETTLNKKQQVKLDDTAKSGEQTPTENIEQTETSRGTSTELSQMYMTDVVENDEELESVKVIFVTPPEYDKIQE